MKRRTLWIFVALCVGVAGFFFCSLYSAAKEMARFVEVGDRMHHLAVFIESYRGYERDYPETFADLKQCDAFGGKARELLGKLLEGCESNRSGDVYLYSLRDFGFELTVKTETPTFWRSYPTVIRRYSENSVWSNAFTEVILE